MMILDNIKTYIAIALLLIVIYTDRRRISQWLKRNQPVRCVDCGCWMRHKNAIPTHHRTTGIVLLCQKCHNNHYTPFSHVKENNE